MTAAVRACTSGFVTPMAAVAGAVADEAVAVLAARPGIERAYVNNGGDVALYLGPGARLSVGVVPSLREAAPRARVEIAYDSAVRGVATSGWQGRSHSLGIADAVTVLARSAALADAAATLIANAVDADHPGIRRVPARTLDEDSDLGDRLVTVAVPELDAGDDRRGARRRGSRGRRATGPGRHRRGGAHRAGTLARARHARPGGPGTRSAAGPRTPIGHGGRDPRMNHRSGHRLVPDLPAPAAPAPEAPPARVHRSAHGGRDPRMNHRSGHRSVPDLPAPTAPAPEAPPAPHPPAGHGGRDPHMNHRSGHRLVPDLPAPAAPTPEAPPVRVHRPAITKARP